MEIDKENDDGSENVEESNNSDESVNDNDINNSRNNNILFNFDIKLSESKTAKLCIYEDDDFDEKIKYFCEAYKIKSELKPTIKKIIGDKLNQELSAQRSSTTSSSKHFSNKDKKYNESILNYELQNDLKQKNNSNSNYNNEEKIKSLINDKNNKKKEIQNEKFENDKLNLKTKKYNTKKYSNSTNEIEEKQKYKENYNRIKKNGVNTIEINKKAFIKGKDKKHPNSAENSKNKKRIEYAGIRLYNNYMNSTFKNNLILCQKFKEKKEQFKFSPEINKNSKKIMENNKNIRNNQKVEDRLLYYGNLITKKKLNAKTNILLRDIKNNSFSPKIDNFSKYIARNMKTERINRITTMENMLGINNDKKKKNIKIMNLKNRYEKRNRSQSPHTNNKINKLLKVKKSISDEERRSYTCNPNKNIYDCLYLESKIDKIIKEKKLNKQLKERYTFKPLISNYTKKILKEKNENKKEFLERISSNKQKYIDRKKECYNKDSFRPKISRGPKNEKQREINENLKGFYDKRLIKQEEELQKNEMKNSKEKKNYYLKKSSELIYKMRMEKFKVLFEKLDSDKDGVISYDKIKLTGINNDILTLISPILKELYENKVKIDYKIFCDKVDKLLTNQNIRNILDC